MVIITKLLAAFTLAKEADGCAKRTLSDYRQHLSSFLEWCANNDIGLDTLSRDDVRMYVAELRRKHSPNTAAIRIRCLRAFLNWVHDEGYTSLNLAKAVKHPKSTPREEEPLDVGEIFLLLAACQGDERAIRDKALILVFLDTGLRLSEMASLQREDLHLGDDQSWLRVCGSKTDTYRYVILGQRTTEALKEYLASRMDTRPALWVGKKRGRLAPEGIYRMIKARAALVGLEDHVHPHLLRRTFCTNFLDNGGDVERLRVLAGWSTLAMLQVYVGSARRRLEQIHRTASPVDCLPWGSVEVVA